MPPPTDFMRGQRTGYKQGHEDGYAKGYRVAYDSGNVKSARIRELEEALKFYAEPNNTTRDCVAHAVATCANVDHCVKAQRVLGVGPFNWEPQERQST